MRKFTMRSFLQLSMVMSLLLAISFQMNAQNSESDEPIITIKTNAYKNLGPTNMFSLVLGTIDAGNIIEVDTGYGRDEYEVNPAVYNEAEGSIVGTFIPCSVSDEGIVRIYGDPEKIDYINASGCYIETIEFPKLANLDILELSHNELKSIDLTNQTKLQAIYMSDNTFTKETPLVIGYKPDLAILEVSIIDWFDPNFNLSDYPKMMSFDGYHCVSLKNIDPSGCPNLYRLTLDVTNVESVDVSKNPELMILNISETKVTSVDVSNNPKLREFYCSHRGAYNSEYKFTSVDVSNNPDLLYFVCSGNKLTDIDISKNPKLQLLDVSDNYLSDIDLSNNKDLYQVYLNLNCMDFATLPVNPGTWNTYYYSQRPMKVDKSYPVNHEFDLSSRVLREESTTTCEMYAFSETNPEEPVKLDRSYYSYSDGKVTLNKVYADSVYFSFSNTLLNENVLLTEKFMVKTQSEYGQPTKVFNSSLALNPGDNIVFSVGIDGATEENPIEFLVNFGDGVKETFYATTSTLPAEPNVTGTQKGYGQLEVYAPEGVTVTALEVKDIMMYSADVSKLPSLRELNLIGTGLYYIDLDWNRCLTSLNLSNNNLSYLSLESKYAGYAKNVLANINLSHNQLSEVVLNELTVIRNLDLSHNQLHEFINFSNGEGIININLSNNQFDTLDFSYCATLKNLDVSHNMLTSIILPQDVCVLEYFACNDNRFTMANLPLHGDLSDENYIYAPQADFEIATKGPGANLTSQNRLIDGKETEFVWKKENGELLVEGVDYEVIDGITSFLNKDMGNVYCEMTHAAFPQFAGEKVFKTTLIEVAGMPTNLIATFTTKNNGDIVELSFAAAKSGTAMYIDWNGNNTVTQYLLEDTYKLFYAETKAGAEVKVYTYEPTDAITVFSMTGAKLSSFDGSKLTDAINISVCGAGLSSITLPDGSENLRELSLEGNKFRRFDASLYPSLTTLALTDNLLTSIDVSENKNLELFSAAHNSLSDVVLDNDKLWALYLDNNNISEIDLSGVPQLKQFSISNNYLSHIDVSNLNKLIMLIINNNYFTFETLPLHKSTYVRYYYHSQFPIEIAAEDGVVDLSSQSDVDGAATIYRWFVGLPTIDEEGMLVGEELAEGEDYLIEEGVTTFLSKFNDVMCVMMNEKLPDVVIYTYLINVTADVEEIAASDEVLVMSENDNIVVKSDAVGSPIAVYSVTGALMRTAEVEEGATVIDNIEEGIYLVRVGKNTKKVIVK